MKIIPLRGLLFAGALCASVVSLRAQVIELRATINSAQENPDTRSTATGSAVMLYDINANTFDLFVTINGLANTATASHIHEAAPGVNGPVVTGLGAENVYTRTGNSLSGTFRGIKHTGDRIKLLTGGAYYNIHSTQFPGGEVRGQLIPQPKRLYATMDVAQEQAAFPAVNLAGLNDMGGAVMLYDPMTNMMRLRLSVFNFNNTMNNSHYHAQIPGISGGVIVSLGNNPNAGGYNSSNGFISGSFDIPMTGTDLITLLTGGMYLNFHSTTFTGGEVRGQVYPSDEVAGTRLGNLSVRGFVGTGDQVLIQGITVNGPEPIRMLISVKGPSLTALGVAGALANPRLDLYDAGRRRIAFNDDIGTTPPAELALIPGAPTNSVESALIVVLPPGNYTAVASSTTGTGIALLEVNDLRNAGTVDRLPASTQQLVVQSGAPSANGKAPVELCTAIPTAVVAGR